VVDYLLTAELFHQGEFGFIQPLASVEVYDHIIRNGAPAFGAVERNGSRLVPSPYNSTFSNYRVAAWEAAPVLEFRPGGRLTVSGFNGEFMLEFANNLGGEWRPATAHFTTNTGAFSRSAELPLESSRRFFRARAVRR
jgi:hypothetical protein